MSLIRIPGNIEEGKEAEFLEILLNEFKKIGWSDFKVTNIGSPGIDAGGLTRQLYDNYRKTYFNPVNYQGNTVYLPKKFATHGQNEPKAFVYEYLNGYLFSFLLSQMAKGRAIAGLNFHPTFESLLFKEPITSCPRLMVYSSTEKVTLEKVWTLYPFLPELLNLVSNNCQNKNPIPILARFPKDFVNLIIQLTYFDSCGLESTPTSFSDYRDLLALSEHYDQFEKERIKLEFYALLESSSKPDPSIESLIFSSMESPPSDLLTDTSESSLQAPTLETGPVTYANEDEDSDDYSSDSTSSYDPTEYWSSRPWGGP